MLDDKEIQDLFKDIDVEEMLKDVKFTDEDIKRFEEMEKEMKDTGLFK